MSFAGRRVLIIGPGLVELTARAMEGAVIETAVAETFHGRWSHAEAPELVLIDSASASAEAIGAAIATLGRAPPTKPSR